MLRILFLSAFMLTLTPQFSYGMEATDDDLTMFAPTSGGSCAMRLGGYVDVLKQIQKHSPPAMQKKEWTEEDSSVVEKTRELFADFGVVEEIISPICTTNPSLQKTLYENMQNKDKCLTFLKALMAPQKKEPSEIPLLAKIVNLYTRYGNKLDSPTIDSSVAEKMVCLKHYTFNNTLELATPYCLVERFFSQLDRYCGSNSQNADVKATHNYACNVLEALRKPKTCQLNKFVRNTLPTKELQESYDVLIRNAKDLY